MSLGINEHDKDNDETFGFVEGLLPSRYLYSEKETFFFVTSRHRNHYNESIYSYGKTVILS
ncbi:hypothetical protein PT047_08895, partial [Erysipelothrix rhusiopathiae]|nr:hypothetical protein [Erysipelothrix rhusiopathiae]